LILTVLRTERLGGVDRELVDFLVVDLTAFLGVTFVAVDVTVFGAGATLCAGAGNTELGC
jgi:hypothetical protein